MIKKCMGTGLMYLCQTTRDPYTYKGSGHYWKRHIEKHKPWIVTCVIGEYNTKEELRLAGIEASNCFNVVESQQWANMIPEQGDGGLIYSQKGNTWTVSQQGRENMAASRRRNKDKYIEARKTMVPKVSGGNNYQSTYLIHTPWGVFETWREATNEAKRLRKAGIKNVVSDGNTLRIYCKSDTMLNSHGRRTPKAWRGKSTKELGFYISSKDIK